MTRLGRHPFICGLILTAAGLLAGCGPGPAAPEASFDPARSHFSPARPVGGQPFTIKDLGLAMQPIPAGKFLMGSPGEEPGRTVLEGPPTEVTISRPFWLGRTPVTQAQWRAVMGTDLAGQVKKYFSNDNDPARLLSGTGDEVAMYYVSWDDAAAFCAKLNDRARAEGSLPAGYEFTLPTEAEWEYACRAGTTAATYAGPVSYYGSNDAPRLDLIAWYAGNSSVGYEGAGWDTSGWPGKQYPGGQAGVRRVGQKQPNAWGLYDMLGNVYEWCLDYASPALPGGSVVDPTGPGEGLDRIIRGGSWHSAAVYCRAASRKWNGPSNGLPFIGFRLALAPRRPR
jgi:formylglycine-generating enzyme required for sulfatase activity